MKISTQRLAGLLYPASLALFVIVPVAILAVPTQNGWGQAAQEMAFPGIAVLGALSLPHILGILALGCLPLAAFLFAIWHLSRLLLFIKRGQIISDHAAGALKRLGAGFGAAGTLGVLVYPFQTLLLTAANPAGMRSLGLSVGSNDIVFMLIGVLLFVLGRALKDAKALSDENKAFI